MKMYAPKMKLLTRYRGYDIELNPYGLIVASQPDCFSFPLIVASIEAAKVAIDSRLALSE